MLIICVDNMCWYYMCWVENMCCPHLVPISCHTCHHMFTSYYHSFIISFHPVINSQWCLCWFTRVLSSIPMMELWEKSIRGTSTRWEKVPSERCSSWLWWRGGGWLEFLCWQWWLLQKHDLKQIWVVQPDTLVHISQFNGWASPRAGFLKEV